MNTKSLTYKHTVVSCFFGYIEQAIINNFAPLLFLTFQSSFGVPLEQISLLVLINFGTQLLVDFVSSFITSKIGYRPLLIFSHITALLGLVLLPILPNVIGNSFVGLVIPTVLYALGGGLNEVLLSPIVEACPTDNKEKAMSLLHSFYCWGHVAVIGISTLYFSTIGIENWAYLSWAYAIVPLINLIIFSIVPLPEVLTEEEGMSFKQIFSNKIFYVFLLLMFLSAAVEQCVSQWVSTFAESALSIDKSIGDLAGTMAFAFLMGLSRFLYGKFGEKINLYKTMLFSSILCLVCYVVIAFVDNPIISLIACGVTGFSVGILWPGAFSKGAEELPSGGAKTFGFFALFGDLGCGVGPMTLGVVSARFGDNLRLGFIAGIVFSAILVIIILMLLLRHIKEKSKAL